MLILILTQAQADLSRVNLTHRSFNTFCCPKSKDRRKLLRQWVESGQNAAAIEADICLMKSQGTTVTSDRELLTVAEMTRKNIPPQKIKAVVSKGNGVPDPDLPGDVSLMKFWVSTATKRVEKEEVNVQQRMKIRADASGASVDAFFENNMGAAGNGSMGSTNVSEIIQAVNESGTPAGVALRSKYVVFKVKVFLSSHCFEPISEPVFLDTLLPILALVFSTMQDQGLRPGRKQKRRPKVQQHLQLCRRPMRTHWTISRLTSVPCLIFTLVIFVFFLQTVCVFLSSTQVRPSRRKSML